MKPKHVKRFEDSLSYPEYTEEDKKKWDDLYEKKIWGANYPFSVNNVAEFAEFCEDSRGFKIW